MSETMYVRRKAGTKDIYEFIDFRDFADAEGEIIKVKRVLKEDNKKEILEAIETLQKQIDDKVLEKEIEKFKTQVAMIEAYELANPEEAPVEKEVPNEVETADINSEEMPSQGN